MKAMNRERAKALAWEVHAVPRECYRNAALATYRFGESDGVEYVEGLLLLSDFGIFITHGWIETASEIFDVTLDDCAVERYFPVFRYSKEQVDLRVRRKKSLPFYAHEQDGFKIMGLKELELWKEIELLYGKVTQEKSATKTGARN